MHLFPATPRRLLAATGALLLGTTTAVVTGAPTAAGAATVGYVRLAHLSPDTPAVDVYLDAPGDGKPQVFPAVGYGVVSTYLPLPVGRYAVAMREAGAPADEPPVLTTEVAVTSGSAHTVAGVGRYADLGLRVLRDDLSTPAAGRARVRVVQASVRAPIVDVAAADGPRIAEGVRFATTSDYREVEPGRWRLRLGGSGGPTTDTEVTLEGGAVYSLLVLDAKQGGLTTELRQDAASGAAVVPAGGIDTGAGGTAGRSAYPLVAGGLAVAALLAGLVLLRRRGRGTW
ncbi:DUF4397 domain-containing protein [Micromonospora endolithica]|uniref:DUF4397 domain-containing protein n=1 Tax=Micromonospora endolithica TaxID=230091 RepID=A0A3A9ZRC2_9ACTN|nr:DUF4397 domain-containing protein [Micromonospora endolithica]RKN50828.1 DUF4397 domain-containing protein [Micromonospora endolithica]TWJ20409.1 uncharacterized protein DUF4397 [Micromonospora endolithica]